MNNGPINPPGNPQSAAQQAMQAIHQNRVAAQQQATSNQAITAQMQQNINQYAQQQNRMYRKRPGGHDPTVTDMMVLELLACGFTTEEIDKLRELASKSAETFTYVKIDKPVYYRPEARERGSQAFGHNRLYKKAHEKGQKKLRATVVYTPLRGFVRPFPECKS